MINSTERLTGYRYNNDNNFKIIDINKESNICYIFCSSNGMYQRVDNENIEEYIQRDHYEWDSISQNPKLKKKAGRYIFLRDVFQSSYVDGINSRIYNIDLIIKLLASHTKGYELIIAGVSAGGYLSMILGCSLDNVSRVYSFGGLLDLYKWTGAKDNFSFKDIPSYCKHLNNADYTKYFSINELICSCSVPIYHFYGLNNKPDCVQIEKIIELNPKNFILCPLLSTSHGGGLASYDYIELLTKNNNQLGRLVNKLKRKKSVSPTYFSLVNLGFLRFIFIKVFRFIKKVIKK